MIAQTDPLLAVAIVVLAFGLVVERVINYKQRQNANDEVEYRVQKIVQARTNAEKDATTRTLACVREASQLLRKEQT